MQRYDLTLTDCGKLVCISTTSHSADAWTRCELIRINNGPIPKAWTGAVSWTIAWEAVSDFATRAAAAGFTLEMV